MLKLRRAIIALFLVYVPVAVWLKFSYVDPAPKGRIVVQLQAPFERFGHAVIARPAELNAYADWEGVDVGTSPVLIYEDGSRLGPPHSNFADISALGHGAYAHWRRHGLVFSTSDNSDPDTNGRRYWAVVP